MNLSYLERDNTESGVVIPTLYKNEPVNFTAQMYLDDEPPISGGREIWGFPKKLGNPKLEVIYDTLTGRLYYADVLVAVGTMSYKHEDIMCDVSNHYICDPRAIADKMSGTQVNLKLIPTSTAPSRSLSWSPTISWTYV